MNTPKIRCKCDKCGRKQLVKVQELVMGNAKCYYGMNSLSVCEPCLGTMNYYSDDYDDTLLNAHATLAYLSSLPFDNQKLAELIDVVADDMNHWASGVQSPQEMGWVGQDGQP